MKKELGFIYITDDGKRFLDKEEAIKYEAVHQGLQPIVSSLTDNEPPKTSKNPHFMQDLIDKTTVINRFKDNPKKNR